MSVALEIHFRIQPIHRREFLQTAESLMSRTSAIPGLEELGCFEEVGTANVFLWRECWVSRVEIEGRLDSPGIKTLLAAIGVLGELDHYEILWFGGSETPRPGWT